MLKKTLAVMKRPLDFTCGFGEWARFVRHPLMKNKRLDSFHSPALLILAFVSIPAAAQAQAESTSIRPKPSLRTAGQAGHDQFLASWRPWTRGQRAHP